MNKVCIRCKISKGRNEFYDDKRLKSGKMATCKKCHSEMQKAIRTPEKQREYNKRANRKIKQNPVKYAKLLAYQRKQYKKHGRKKFPNKCIVCKKIFYSVRKDRKFCSRECISGGKYNGRWKGGRYKNSQGYMVVYTPFHPYAYRNYVREHRLIMEKHLKRLLTPKEVVHHINGIKDDNRLENLLLLATTNKHTKLHVCKGIKGVSH